GTYPETALAEADAPYRRWLRPRLRSGSLVAWVAEARGRPVASACVWVQPVQPRPTMPGGRIPYLLSVYVDPAHRGRGLATRLTKAAIAWCEAEGHAKLALHASAQGRGVYERLGFEPTTEMRLTLRPRGRRRAPPAPPPHARTRGSRP
ncbi:MAG TPA: GNAT family N-acetyltransferase, partial [Candidatus Thermoplasmatota archaeon]|nr:GNAT family N-acetyltransferase [Candidatus Thermoplasmatota archaeon]